MSTELGIATVGAGFLSGSGAAARVSLAAAGAGHLSATVPAGNEPSMRAIARGLDG